jgi:hypothetical protein
VDEDKVLLVRAGGTLEIHGSKKLPNWWDDNDVRLLLKQHA